MKISNFIPTSTFNNLFNVDNSIIKHKTINKYSHMKIGDCAGTLDSCGYLRIHYKSKTYSAHRQLYAYYHNIEILENNLEIDHIDGNKQNNSIENLRLCTKSQNKCNDGSIRGIIKHKGISLHRNKYSTQYRADVHLLGNRVSKLFEYSEQGLELAKEWLNNKRIELHGEFANFGDEWTGTHNQINNIPVKQ